MRNRPEIVGPDGLAAPYPIYLTSHVYAGFGRGSSELGCPTANIASRSLDVLEDGVYFGWAKVSPTTGSCYASAVKAVHLPEASQGRRIDFNYGSELSVEERQVFPMVMSIGTNPHYNNAKRSAEVHLIHSFNHTFYGAEIEVAICGFIRGMYTYESIDGLVEDIRTDIRVAQNSLNRSAYRAVKDLFSKN